MNNRLSIQDLAGILAKQSGREKKSIELFLREFIAVVTEGVFTDKLVKIKGIGTFKIILVEKRESIHVNTGERILIPAHYKFSFTPDKKMREEVNRPFSIFETIELNEGVDFSELEHKEEEPVADAAQEIHTPVSEADPEERVGAPEQMDVNPVEPKPDHLPVAESPVHVIETSVVTEELMIDPLHSGKVETEPVKETETPEIPEVSPKPVPVKNQERPVQEEISSPESSHPAKETPYSTVQSTDKKNITSGSGSKSSGKRLLISFLLIIGMGVGIGYVFTNHILSEDPPEQSVIPASLTTVPEVITPEEATPGTAESITGDEQTQQEEPGRALSAEPAQEILATVPIEAGSRLTLIALEHYGHKLFWVYIYEFNKATIQDPNNIPIGTLIKVPSPELYGIDRRSKTSLEKAAELQTAILTGQ